MTPDREGKQRLGARPRSHADAGGGKKRILRLSGVGFIDRFLLHVLPQGFKRIRHYGVLGPAGKAVKLAQARAALAVPPPDPPVVESLAAFMLRIDRLAWMRCRHCGQGYCVPTAALAPVPGRAPPPRAPP